MFTRSSTNCRVSPIALRLFGAAVLLFFSGCNNAKYGNVTGQVTLDGKPLPQVAVRFEDERGSATIARTT